MVHIANVIFLRKDVITLVFYINWLVSFWNILFAVLPQNIIILLPYIGTRLILLNLSWSCILIHRNDKSIVMLNHVWTTWSNQVGTAWSRRFKTALWYKWHRLFVASNVPKINVLKLDIKERYHCLSLTLLNFQLFDFTFLLVLSLLFSLFTEVTRQDIIWNVTLSIISLLLWIDILFYLFLSHFIVYSCFHEVWNTE